jgi:hypothetical protein
MYFMEPNNKIRNITQLEILGLDIKKNIIKKFYKIITLVIKYY